MTGLTATAIRAVRQRFGDDADAVLALRAAHKTVRPFGDRFAVDEEIVDSAELQRMADAVIARREGKAQRARMVAHKITKTTPERAASLPQGKPDQFVSKAADAGRPMPGGTKQKTAGLGNPSAGKSSRHDRQPDGHGSALADPIHESCGRTESGRVSEAMAGANVTLSAALNAQSEMVEGVATRQAGVAPGPQDTIAATCPCSRPRGHGGRCWYLRGMSGPTLKRAQPRGSTCAGCAGPLSRSAAGDLCRKCVLAKVRKSSGLPARLAALEARQEAFEAKVKAAVADLVAHLGLGETR